VNKDYIYTDNDFSKRDKSVDIIKGIAIVLVVYCHTYPFCNNFIRFINLPVFLLCSGYCFKKNIISLVDYRLYMIRKLRTLYLPCAVYNGIFAIFSGLFLHLGFYTDDPKFLTMTKSWPVPQKLHIINGLSDILYKLLRVIFITDTTQMGTGTWMIIVLFLICTVNGAFCIFVLKLSPKIKHLILITTVIILSLLLQFVIPTYGSFWQIKCGIFCFFTYYVGICLQMIDIRHIKKIPCLIICLMILLLLSPFYYIDLANAMVKNVYIYLLGILAGWFMLKIISEQLAKSEKASRVLCFLGRNTIPIVCLHILCFKLVTWLYIKVNKTPKIYLASFHIDFDVSESWKLLYLLVGVVIPVILSKLWKTFLNVFSSHCRGFLMK